MNPLARFFGLRSREIVSPFSPGTLQAATFEHLFDVDATTHTTVTRAEAMSVAPVAKGRQLICGAISRLPIIGMNGTVPMKDRPKILEQLEAGRPLVTSLSWIVDHLMFYGFAYLIVTHRHAEDQRPRQFAWVPQWEADITTDGHLTKAFGKPVNAQDVVRIDAPHEGILNFASERIRAARRLDKAALTASMSPVPSIELHQVSGTPLTPTEAQELVAAYVASRKKSGVSYTNQSIETRTHGTPVENLLIDGRKAAALDIARVMCLPAWALDAPAEGQSMTYTNVPSRARELIDYTLAPYMAAITARLSMDDILPRSQWCRFDTDPLLADDFASRMTSYKTALETGIYTIDDLKARENGIPLER